MMKILIPENCVLWTTKGLCFPKDLICGVEIFVIDPEGKLVTVPIMDDIAEPEEMKVCTIFTQNNTLTSIPNYKIQTDNGLIQIEDVQKELETVDLTYLTKFKEFHNEHAVEFAKKSPFSVLGASYLASCGIKDSKNAAYFQLPDRESMYNYAKELQGTMISELGGDVSVIVANRSKWGKEDVGYLVLYRSEKFLKLRKLINLREDKILNSIYQNGLNIYFGFLRSLLGTGFSYHLDSFIRGKSEKYVILNLPWKSTVRKLLQDSCHLWNTYQLSLYQNRSQMSVNELKIERKIKTIPKQSVLEIKEHLMNCYEIEIPIGNKIILDNAVLKPFELTEDEIEELKNFEEQGLDLTNIRKRITASISSDVDNLKTISQLKLIEKEFHLHVVGIIKNKGKVNSTTTRYGKTISVNVILYDESGEIKTKIWGEVANEIKEGQVLELSGARTQNGILHNTKSGWEKIHKLEEKHRK